MNDVTHAMMREYYGPPATNYDIKKLIDLAQSAVWPADTLPHLILLAVLRRLQIAENLDQAPRFALEQYWSLKRLPMNEQDYLDD